MGVNLTPPVSLPVFVDFEKCTSSHPQSNHEWLHQGRRKLLWFYLWRKHISHVSKRTDFDLALHFRIGELRIYQSIYSSQRTTRCLNSSSPIPLFSGIAALHFLGTPESLRTRHAYLLSQYVFGDDVSVSKCHVSLYHESWKPMKVVTKRVSKLMSVDTAVRHVRMFGIRETSYAYNRYEMDRKREKEDWSSPLPSHRWSKTGPVGFAPEFTTRQSLVSFHFARHTELPRIAQSGTFPGAGLPGLKSEIHVMSSLQWFVSYQSESHCFPTT